MKFNLESAPIPRSYIKSKSRKKTGQKKQHFLKKIKIDRKRRTTQLFTHERLKVYWRNESTLSGGAAMGDGARRA